MIDERKIVRVIDLETTGLPAPETQVIEIAAVDLIVEPLCLPRFDRLWGLTSLVKPTIPIPPEASAVHHLIDEDLEQANFWADVWPCYVDNVDVFAAHSAKFERYFLSDEMTHSRPWVCTWKCALRLWPQAPSHSNQALRYWKKPPHLTRTKAALSHRALPDAYVTAHLLAAMLEEATLDSLIAWTAEPALLPRITFGAMRGRPWSEADDGLLHWVLGKDFDEDVKFTVRTELKRRAAENKQPAPIFDDEEDDS